MMRSLHGPLWFLWCGLSSPPIPGYQVSVGRVWKIVTSSRVGRLGKLGSSHRQDWVFGDHCHPVLSSHSAPRGPTWFTR